MPFLDPASVPLVDTIEASIEHDLYQLMEQLKQASKAELYGDFEKVISDTVSYADIAIQSVKRLHLTAREQTEEGIRQTYAFQAFADVSALDARLASIAAQSVVGNAVGAISGAIHSLIGHLQPIVHRVSSHLWQLISRLLTLRSWKVSGEIGTGPFGLAHTKIELSFG